MAKKAVKKTQKTLEHALNISKGEWGRLGIAWMARFLFQTGLIVGWTLIVAIFTSQFGVDDLATLFFLNALLVILGSFFFSFLIGRFAPYKLIFGSILVSVGILLFSYNSLTEQSGLIFIFSAMVCYALLGSQMSILLSNFTERLFTPLEGERMFPLVESAETIGGVAAGAIAVFGLRYFTPMQLIFAWAGAWALLGFLFVVYRLWTEYDLPKLIFEEEEDVSKMRIVKMFKGFGHLRRFKFLRYMALAVFLQWFAFTFIDLQFTFVVEEHATHAYDSLHHAESDDIASLMTHGLGTLHMIFYGVGLLVQLFLASRILGKLGIVQTYLIHPLVSAITTIAFLTGYGYNVVVYAKGQNEATGILAKNSTHASFYSFPEKNREAIKEFIEGVMRPLGMLFSAVVLMCLEYFIGEHFEKHLITNLILFGGFVLMIVCTGLMKRPYTEISKKILERPHLHPDKFDAIEVLAQPGHYEPTLHLVRLLNMTSEHEKIKIKTIQTLGMIGDAQVIPDLLKQVEGSTLEIRIQAVRALTQFEMVNGGFYHTTFAKFRIVNLLEELLSDTKTPKLLRKEIMKLFAKMHEEGVIPMLVKMTEDEDDEVRADGAYLMGYFDDPAVEYYLDKLLHDKNGWVKANAVISLWQFKRFRLKLLMVLSSLLESSDKQTVLAGVYASGEIHAVQEEKLISKIYNKTDDDEVQKYCSFALAKMGHDEALHEIIERIIEEDDKNEVRDLKLLAKQLPEEMKISFDKHLRRMVSVRVKELIGRNKERNAKRISREVLEKISHYYNLISEEGEMMKINMILTQNEIEKCLEGKI